jgi:hypothetical protein
MIKGELTWKWLLYHVWCRLFNNFWHDSVDRHLNGVLNFCVLRIWLWYGDLLIGEM